MRNAHRPPQPHDRRAQHEAQQELSDLVRRYREILANPPRAEEWRPRRLSA